MTKILATIVLSAMVSMFLPAGISAKNLLNHKFTPPVNEFEKRIDSFYQEIFVENYDKALDRLFTNSYLEKVNNYRDFNDFFANTTKNYGVCFDYEKLVEQELDNYVKQYYYMTLCEGRSYILQFVFYQTKGPYIVSDLQLYENRKVRKIELLFNESAKFTDEISFADASTNALVLEKNVSKFVDINSRFELGPEEKQQKINNTLAFNKHFGLAKYVKNAMNAYKISEINVGSYFKILTYVVETTDRPFKIKFYFYKKRKKSWRLNYYYFHR